ncbi:MAG: ATP-binding protein [Saprospiraceae bacterium]
MKNQLPVIFLTFANDKVDDALYLRNLPKELNAIRNALVKAEKAGLCEVIERTACTVEDIFDTFQDPRYEGRIAMFHYGGHASGSQLMLETLDGDHGTAHAEGLVSFLGKQNSLQVAFFNGCSSQEQAMELSEAGVPAVVGTATAIKDVIATDLAGRFYTGIASGFTVNKSWLEAVDVLKTKNDTKKKKGLRLRRDKGNDFPWRMYIRDGAEVVRDWDLPSAANSPLFGLPELPKTNLPEYPFMFLRRYEPQHAEIFFGRDRYIRQLYDRITSDKAAPVILFYGQSGAGKSSALAAGLLPRLEQEADVKYIRRNSDIGLLGTFDEALGGNIKRTVLSTGDGQAVLVSDLENQIAQMESLRRTIDTTDHGDIQRIIDQLKAKLGSQETDINTEEETATRLERWIAIEENTGRPFNILLDQVEETFTRANPNMPNELELFLLEIQQIFKDAGNCPDGNIILSYRKEYHPEIDEFCKKLQIPREGIFLKRLTTEDIEEVVRGVASNKRLEQRYNIIIEPNLPNIIADDLTEDRESPIAPVLSILLTKMWELSREANINVFSVTQYQNLKKQGIMMEDFFHQQMVKLKNWKPELEASGLALDILNFHTTALGTAGMKNVDEIKERYQHQTHEVDALIDKFKELYLLTDIGYKQTGLSHDTLAPIVNFEIRESDKSGQRAYRTLTNNALEFEDDETNIMDPNDLKLVEDGQNGMRLWNDLEIKLVEASKKYRDRQVAIRRNLIIAAVAIFLVVIGQSIYSYFQSVNARSNFFELQGLTAYGDGDFTEAYDFAVQALDVNAKNTEAKMLLIQSRYANLDNFGYQFYFTPRKVAPVNFKGNPKSYGRINEMGDDLRFEFRTFTSKEGKVEVFNELGEALYSTSLTKTNNFLEAQYSPDLRYLVSANDVTTGEDSIVFLIKVEDVIQETNLHQSLIKLPKSLKSYLDINQIRNSLQFSPNSTDLFYYVPTIVEKEITVAELETFQVIDTIEIINKKTALCRVLADSLEMFELNEHSVFKFGGTLSSITTDGKYLTTSEGIIYDLSKENGVYLDSEMKNVSAQFFDNNEKVAFSSPTKGVKVYSLMTKELLSERPVEERNIESYQVTDDNQYLVIQLNAKSFEVRDMAMDTLVIEGQGIYKYYQAQDTLFFAAKGANTTWIYVHSQIGNSRIHEYDGKFEQVLPNQMLFATTQGIAPNNFTNIYRLPTLPESLPRTSILPDVEIREDGFEIPIFHFLGAFLDVNENGKYILTNKGLFDIQASSPRSFSSNIQLGADKNSIYFTSKDGKYLIEERGNITLVEELISGDTLKSSKTEHFIKKTWLPYKEAAYGERLNKLYDFIENKDLERPTFQKFEEIEFLTLKEKLSVEYNFHEIFLRDENGHQIARWTTPTNHYIISLLPKANGKFLELIYAGTQIDKNGVKTRVVQTILFDLE